MNHLTIFDALYPKFKIDKPIRLITLFSGYDSQALALKYLDVPFQHYRTCEWAVKSIQALKDLHFKDVNVECDLSKEELVEELFDLGISSNYNEPMTRKQIERLSLDQLTKIWKNIKETNNMVNIQKATANTLGITNTDIYIYIYILTYSFPCQDLSLAGKGKGMSDTSTRSGMLWEVERILKELKETDSLPQVLLMENVPMIHSTDNTPDFNKWQLELTKLGYKNYWEDLIATDYGIPQTRNRCFMVSILGDYNYSFPRPIKLEKKLKDMLEDNVDKKYYLSDKQIKDIQNWNAYEKPLENMEKTDKNNISPTLTTRSGAYAAGMVLVKDTENYIEWEDGKNIQMNCRAWKDDKVVATLNTGGETKILTTQCDNGVVVMGNYTPSNHNASRIVNQNYSAPTVMENHGTITATQTSDLRIRKLTPKECFRLMGVKDEDYEKIKVNQSDSSLYHLAGDSIVVNVLMAIFKELY